MMTGVIILDQNVGNSFELLAPHYGMHDTGSPGTIRHIAKLPDPIVQNISNFIDSEVLVIE